MGLGNLNHLNLTLPDFGPDGSITLIDLFTGLKKMIFKSLHANITMTVNKNTD